MEQSYPSSKMPMEKSFIPPPAYRTRFASLSLHSSDRIRVLRFPPEIISAIKDAIITCWGEIQSERPSDSSYEFKLRGRPWDGSGSEATGARQLMKGILATLYNHGWILVASTDVAKRELDKDVLLFRLQSPAPAPCEWMGVSFSRQDRLRLYDAPPELCEAVHLALSRYVQSREGTNAANVFELKLHGYPWGSSSKSSSEEVRNLLLDLLQVLEEHGFTLYASVDQKRTQLDADSWYCCRAVGWAPGQPVFHA